MENEIVYIIAGVFPLWFISLCGTNLYKNSFWENMIEVPALAFGACLVYGIIMLVVIILKYFFDEKIKPCVEVSKHKFIWYIICALFFIGIDVLICLYIGGK